MSSVAVRAPAAFEAELARYVFDRSEEARAVRVGEKEVSEQAAIVARYADLFTREQLDALRAAEAAAGGDEHEQLYRLRKACESGLVAAELAERSDELENALLAVRVVFRDEELTLRSAQARLATLEPYLDREELGELHADASARFNPDRLELLHAGESLEAELSGERDAVRRHEDEKQISLERLASVAEAASAELDESWRQMRARWFDRVLGRDRDDVPTSSHVGYIRRLSPLASTYTKELATDVCLRTLSELGFDVVRDPHIRLDLDDRPQKAPRACVIASEPPRVVHLITRAQGGLHDYEAFLHEAGHALHYANCDPRLPYTFRKLARDHALTEIYSYVVESIIREPGWHVEHFALPADVAAANAEATRFVELLLFRRYAAKLRFELGFWSRFPEDASGTDYEELLTAATGLRYRRDNYLADMDAGFYSADYLRAWIRSAQLREVLARDVGEDWWRRRETGERLRELFREGTRPTSEEIATRIGYDAYDTRPLVRELVGRS